MAWNEDFDFDGAMKELIARKSVDPDKILFDGKVEIVKEACAAGVSVVDIFGLFKNAGFNGGRDKLVRFMNEGGLQNKRKHIGDEKKRNCKRNVKIKDENAVRVERVTHVPTDSSVSSSGDGAINIVSDSILD